MRRRAVLQTATVQGHRATSSWVGALCVVASGVWLPPFAFADEGEAVVWYRSGPGCPEGAEFLAELSARGVPARLASVGDTIDFVVTLGGGAGTGLASGSLERQSASGTVALRRVDDESCPAIAEALALTLALTYQSDKDARLPKPAAAEREPEREPEPEPERQAHPHPVRADSATLAPGSSATGRDAEARWHLGLHASAARGLAPSFLYGGSLFLAFDPASAWRPELRASAEAHFGSAELAERATRAQVLVGALEGCPLTLGQTLRLQPCIGVALGRFAADRSGPDGRSAAEFWASLAAIGRGTVQLADPLRLEAEVALFVPLTRYELYAGSRAAAAYETATAGVAVGLGAAVALP